MNDAAIWIDPARRSGQPCIAGTRLTCEHAATTIWATSVDEYLSDYEVGGPRRSVLCAVAWWVLNTKGGPKWHSEIRNAWRKWAELCWLDAWNTVDPIDLSDPHPQSDALETCGCACHRLNVPSIVADCKCGRTVNADD